MTRPQLVTIFGREYLLPAWYPPRLVTGLALLDQGRRVFSTAAPRVPFPELSQATIVIAKPDHFGDLIQATALLRALRDRLPRARLVLVHGSWAQDVGAWLVANDYVHELVTYDAAWLQPAGTPWPTRLSVERATRLAAAKTLRAMRPAAYLDIRCGTPSTIDLAIESEAALRIGFGLRGRSWQYHERIPYRVDASLPQNWLHALDVLGLPPATYVGPSLPAVAPLSVIAPIIVQPGSRSRAKEAPLSLWQSVLPRLAAMAPIMLVGNADDRSRFSALGDLIPADRLDNRMGRTTFAELVLLAGGARGAVGVESMVAHLAVGYGRPTVVLNNPVASGRIAFPDGLDSLLFCDITTNVDTATDAIVAHFSAFLP